MNLAQTYSEWADTACTVRYTRHLVKYGTVQQTWKHETAKFDTIKEANEAINEWNRVAVMMFEKHPENGLWIFVQEDK